MEHTVKKNAINHLTDKRPWYFGTYFSLACHNIYLLARHCNEQFKHIDGSVPSDERDIGNKQFLTQLFNPDDRKNDAERYPVFKHLVKKHYLPLLKVFHKDKGRSLDSETIVRYGELHRFIKEIFVLLVSLRDYYTHAIAIDNNTKQTKKKRHYVKVDTGKIIEELFQMAPEFAMDRFKADGKEEHFSHLDLYHLFDQKKEDCWRLSEHGLYFICCMFLERKDAMMFLKGISGFKNDTIPPFKATLRTFMSYCPKLPDLRLESENAEFKLFLDMLNELHRCPAILYKVLGEKDRKKFSPRLSPESIDNIMENTDYQSLKETDLEALLENTNVMRRYSDRFPLFALSFLDQKNLIKGIRFQLNLGVIVTDKYKKAYAGQLVDRRVSQAFLCFGLLEDFKKLKSDPLQYLYPNGVPENMAFEQYAPRYHIKNNNIYFKLTNEAQKDPIMDAIPDGCISTHDLPKLVLMAIFGKKDNKKTYNAETIIREFIKKSKDSYVSSKSLLELEKGLQKKHPIWKKTTKPILEKGKPPQFPTKDSIRQSLKKYGLTREKIFELNGKALAKIVTNNRDRNNIFHYRQLETLKERKKWLESNLPADWQLEHLPQKSQDYLMNLRPSDKNNLIVARIKKLKRETSKRLSNLQQYKKDQDSYIPKTGEIADFLVKDIVDMVAKKETKNKITSFPYRKLQENIAYFGARKGIAKELLCNLGIFDRQNGHVFLRKEHLDRSEDILGFYRLYLQTKIRWIEQNLVKRKEGYYLPNNRPLPYVLTKLKEQKSFDLKEWSRQKAAMPVCLPNKLLDDKLEELLKDEVYKQRLVPGEKDKFSKLLEKLLKGDSQPFYNFDREYRIKETIEVANVTGMSSKILEKKLGKRAAKIEKLIRFEMTKDRVMLCMCHYLLDAQHSNISISQRPTLSKMIPFSEGSPLKSPTRFSHKLKSSRLTIIAEDTDTQKKEVEKYLSLESMDEKEAYTGQKGYEWTYGDFGRFHRYVHDRRLNSLFKSRFFHQNIKEIPIQFISYQLSEYDKYRLKAYESIYRLETLLFERFSNEIIRLKLMGNPTEEEIRFKPYLSLLKSKELVSEEEAETLEEIRNGFAHNQIKPIKMNGFPLSLKDMDGFMEALNNKNLKTAHHVSIPFHIYNSLHNILDTVFEKLESKKEHIANEQP